MDSVVKVFFEAVDDTKGASDSAVRNFQRLQQAASVVAGGVGMAAGVAKKAIEEFTAYGDQVQAVMRATGANSEESSKLIQVTDDLFISYEALAQSMKGAVKKGIDPSIEGLARLSDEYLSLAPGVERSKFLLDTFGKSGMEMGKMMEIGAEGIRKMAEATPKGLILSPSDVATANALKTSFDGLGDAINSFTYNAVGGAAPAVNGLISAMTSLIGVMDEGYTNYQTAVAVQKEYNTLLAQAEEATRGARGVQEGLTEAQREQVRAQAEANVALREYYANTTAATKATEDFTSAADDAAASAYNMSKLSGIEGAQKNFDDLAKAQQKYITDMQEVQAQQDSMAPEEYAKKIGEIESAYDAAAAGSKRWVNGFIVDMMTAQAMADQVMTGPEMQGILTFMESVGMVDPKVADLVQQTMDAFNSGDPAKMKAATDALNAYNDAASAKPSVTAPIAPYVAPKPIGWKHGEPIYSDADQAAIAAHDAQMKAQAAAPATKPTAFAPTPQQAQATQQTSKSVSDMSASLAKVDAGVVSGIARLMDSISALNPKGLEKALADMKELFSYDGKSITVYETTIQTTETSAV
jgi:hypothetical protein